jgi:predicted metal-dependent hydrolase
MPMKSTTCRRLQLGDEQLAYDLKRYRGQKRINMHVRDHGLLVTAPLRTSVVEIEDALLRNEQWIIEHVLAHQGCAHITYDEKVISHIKDTLLPVIEAKIDFYNYYYHFNITDISIRNQRTRWGSCSSTGSLNFNVHLAVLPERLMDYVIVHELCHLKEMNHSARFWTLVAQCIPDYMACKKALKSYSLKR